MLSIGIEKNHELVYEGTGNYGRAVWPSPIITPAKIVFESDESLTAEKSNDPITRACRFREDFYDPISRIRRGRFYFAGGSQPKQWFLQPHPAMPSEATEANMPDFNKYLETFDGNPIWYEYIKDQKTLPLVLLGLDDRFTVWKIIDVEAISTGEDLVTLKARSRFGVLPDINVKKVPEAFRGAVNESLNSFVDEVHHSAPTSVIDRARDAASQILLAYFNSTGKQAKDLSALAKELDNKKLIIASSAAKIIARLHARAKPVEQQKRQMRCIREQDAVLATQCVGVILCELGWADWA